MGVLSDVFIATEAEAKALGETQPLPRYQGADVKGIDTVKPDILLGMVQGRPFDAKLQEFPKVLSVSDDGPWVFRLSPALVDFLGGLDESGIASWASRWSEIEEFKLDAYDRESAVEVLREFVRLSRQAKAQNKGLFLWNCL